MLFARSRGRRNKTEQHDIIVINLISIALKGNTVKHLFPNQANRQRKRREKDVMEIASAIAHKLEEKNGQKSDLTLQFKILIVLWAACGVTLVVNLVHSYAWVNWLTIAFALMALLVNIYPAVVAVVKDIRGRRLRR